jgi:hypothetical protein
MVFYDQGEATERMTKNAIVLILLFSPLILAAFQYPGTQDISEKSAEQDRLKEILNKTGEYCRLLEKAAIDFICLEEISEKIDWSRDYPWIRPRFRENTYVYDYQFIKKDYGIEEARILLEENGMKRYEKNADLKTSAFQYQNILYGPIDLLSKARQDYFDYRIMTEDKVVDDTIVILEAIPRSNEQFVASGKIWIKRDDFSVLKIIWHPKSIRNFEKVAEIAERYKSEPDVTIITEFSFEKNTIRFPGEYRIIEAYINKKGKRFLRSETTVDYRNYKFFTVEVKTDAAIIK